MKIAVLAGGRSDERDVSLRSGKACHQALIDIGHEAILMDFCDINSCKELLSLAPELCFLALHGSFGEDGCIQGLLEWAKIPYTGSGVIASALCMDKLLSKEHLRAHGLPVAPGMTLHQGQERSELLRQWHCQELFCKPVCGGSSVGARAIHDESDWEEALKSQQTMLVEPLLTGREVTLSFIEKQGRWLRLPILELKPKGEFYDYISKYTEGQTEFLVPAPLEDSLAEQLQDLGEQALNACDVRGAARVDFILIEQGPSILEINTFPVMTVT